MVGLVCFNSFYAMCTVQVGFVSTSVKCKMSLDNKLEQLIQEIHDLVCQSREEVHQSREEVKQKL